MQIYSIFMHLNNKKNKKKGQILTTVFYYE